MEPSKQAASAASTEPTSADTESQGSSAVIMPADELQPEELAVASALVEVLNSAGREGRPNRMLTKKIMCSNNPIARGFIDLLPDQGQISLHSLSVGAGTQKALSVLSKQCEEAACEPVEVFTRSAACTRHLSALLRVESGGMVDRLQRLRARVLAVIDSSISDSQNAHPATALFQRAEQLTQQGVSQPTCTAIAVVFMELLSMVTDDDKKRGFPTMAGHASSFTACLDHMVPGALDGLLSYKGDACGALLALSTPLEKVVESYRLRAVTLERIPHLVMLEAAVQGWPSASPDPAARACFMNFLSKHLCDVIAASELPPPRSASLQVPDNSLDVEQAPPPEAGLSLPEEGHPDVDSEGGNSAKEAQIPGQSSSVVGEADDAAKQCQDTGNKRKKVKKKPGETGRRQAMPAKPLGAKGVLGPERNSAKEQGAMGEQNAAPAALEAPHGAERQAGESHQETPGATDTSADDTSTLLAGQADDAVPMVNPAKLGPDAKDVDVKAEVVAKAVTSQKERPAGDPVAEDAITPSKESGHLGQKLAVDQPAGQVHAMSEAADGDVIRPSGRLTMQGAMPVTMKTAEQRPKPPMDKVQQSAAPAAHEAPDRTQRQAGKAIQETTGVLDASAIDSSTRPASKVQVAVRTEEGISDTTALHQASSATAEAPQPPLEVQNSVMQSAALKEQPWQEVRKGSKQAGSLDVPKGRSQAKFKQPSHPRRAQAISYHPTQASQRTLPPPKALKPESGVVPSSRNLPLRPPLTWTQSAQNPYMQGQGQGQGQGRAQSQSSQEETGKRLDNTPVTLPLEEQLALCQQQQWQQRESLQAQMFQVQEHHEQLQQLQAQVAQVQQEQRQQQEHLQAQLSQLQQQQQAQPQGAAPAAAMPYTLDELFHMFYYQPGTSASAHAAEMLWNLGWNYSPRTWCWYSHHDGLNWRVHA